MYLQRAAVSGTIWKHERVSMFVPKRLDLSMTH